MLSIEKGINIPRAYNSQSEFLLTLRQLQIGESFLVTVKVDHGKAKAAVSNYKKREGKGKEFTSRKMSDGLRIWRTK